MTCDDEQTFAELYRSHVDAVHALLIARLNDRAAAADLLQETFLRLWRHLGHVQALPSQRQRAWLFTVARNLTIDHYRSRATERDRDTVLAHNPLAAVPHPDEPGRHVVLGEQVHALGQLIASLPEDQRVVLALSTIADMTSTDIAGALGIPAGTVRYRLHQARQHLTANLDLEH